MDFGERLGTLHYFRVGKHNKTFFRMHLEGLHLVIALVKVWGGLKIGYSVKAVHL